MKQTLAYTTFCLLLVFTSCSEKQLEVYHGDNYVYFTYMNGKSPQRMTFSFATDALLLRKGTVKMKMTLPDYLLRGNATCNISAVGEKSTTHSGINYTLLTSGIFHKGPTEDTYEIAVYRNGTLFNIEYILTLSLDVVRNYLVSPAEYRYVTVQVTDRIFYPVRWSQNSAANLRVYSDMKYRVFAILIDGEIFESLDKHTGIEFTNLIANFKTWRKDQWQQGNYQYYDIGGITPLYETILDS